MSLTVIHPFGAYQVGDSVPAEHAAAILASENAANVVVSGTHAQEQPPSARDMETEEPHESAPVSDYDPS